MMRLHGFGLGSAAHAFVDKLAPLQEVDGRDLLRGLLFASCLPLSHMLPRLCLGGGVGGDAERDGEQARRNSGDKSLHGDVSSDTKKQFRSTPTGSDYFPDSLFRKHVPRRD